MMCLAFASSAPWYHHRRCKQCLCMYKAPCLARTCWAASQTLCPCSTRRELHFSHTILLTSTKSLHDKAPRPRQRVSEGFASFCGCFPCRGSTRSLTYPAGGSCMVQKQKAAASLQRPIARRGAASRISKQRVTAACSVLWGC